MKKKILVTGSSGFIAPHIIEECLLKGWKVVAIDKKKPNIKIQGVKYLTKDIRKLSVREIYNFDYVIHMAFVTNIPFSIKEPLSTTNDNINMTVYLMDLCVKAGVKKFLFPSTASLYANNPIPWNENMKPDPIEPYSWQKLSCEYLCKMWFKRYGLKTVTLRLFQVFGENQRTDTALSKFIESKKLNRPITLTASVAQSTFKTGLRDFVYVKDVAKAFLFAANSKNTGKGEILNIGSGKMTSMKKIAETIGGSVKFIPKRSFEVDAHLADLRFTKKTIKWKSRVNIIIWLKNFLSK